MTRPTPSEKKSAAGADAGTEERSGDAAGDPTVPRAEEVLLAQEQAKGRLAVYGDKLFGHRRATKRFHVIAGIQMRCEDSTLCSSERKCAGYYGRTCEVASEEVCRNAEPCRVEGLCKFRDGRCVVGTDEDCRRADVCFQGQCVAGEQMCLAKRDVDCERAYVCEVFGMCSARGGLCVAASASHCAASRVCRYRGRCHLRAGACVALSGVDCRKPCRLDGACVLIGDECLPTSDERCALSEACDSGWRCFQVKGHCATEMTALGGRLKAAEVKVEELEARGGIYLWGSE